jgi:hypothetical protein
MEVLSPKPCRPGAVGESIGKVSATVGEGYRDASAVEVVRRVGSAGLFPDEPKGVDVIGGAYAC